MDIWQLYDLVTLPLYLGVLSFASVAGKAPQRWVAALTFTTLCTTWLVQATLGNVVLLKLAIDAGYAVAMLALLARYKQFWIGTALCSQSLLLAFSSTRLVQFPLTELEYVSMLNLSSLGVFVSLFVGTLLGRRKQPDDPFAWGY